MANFKRPFGSNKVVRTEDDNDTPQQKKFERATGKDSDSAVGDVPHKAPQTNERNTAPSGVNKDLWAQAESHLGTMSGTTPEGRKVQIQAEYDKMVASDKQSKEWAGGSGILGDIGNDKPKD